MRGLTLIPPNTNIRFIDRRMIFLWASALFIAASVILFAFRGLNYGIDFTGGILIEVRVPGGADLGRMRGQLSALGLGEVGLQEFGAPDDVLVRVQRQKGGEEAQQRAIDAVKTVLGPNVDYRRTEFVGPKVSRELFWSGVTAVGFALLAILVYIWFRFEYQFGICAVIALAHDVLSTIGVFSMIGFEFNLSTVAAILTIAGYSINDTVVVFDRVRENLRKFKTMPLAELLNKSINDTLSRTLMTSLTTLLALFSLYFLGGEVIRGFSFAMIWGVLVGTYSSVCIAVPLLLYMGIHKRPSERAEGAKGAEANAEDPPQVP